MKTLKCFLFLLLCAAANVPAFADGTINMANPSNGTGWTFSGNVVIITANGDYVVTGTSTANRVVINPDVTATVTLQNASIRSAVASPFALSSDSTGGSQVTLILSGSNELVSTYVEGAGLTVEDNARLTIQGDGSLLAQGGDSSPYGGGAGIGGGARKDCGNIVITGGTVTATGGIIAAGIGGGNSGEGGNVTITGGMVTATGGYQAAGIGGGQGKTGGNITISGGTVTAIGGVEASGIGGGRNGAGGNITISGGIVNATGGNAAAGIGGGGLGAGGNITVSGGMITATGGVAGAGIGGGRDAGGGNITINSGTVIAIAPAGESGDAAGIGAGGFTGGAGMISITGGTVYASSGGGTGIGDISGAVNITGGTVIADQIGKGVVSISGATTVVLSPSINATTYGGATVLTGNDVDVFITMGDTVADVTLNAALTIPSGAILVIPAGIVFDLNYKTLTNSGIIREYGSLLNKGSLAGNQPVSAIQSSWITDILPQIYTGDSIEPAVTVSYGSLTLTPGVYYSVAYTDNVNAGTATATVTDLGDYHTVTKTFTITATGAQIQIAAGWIAEIPAQAYTGDSIKPAIRVTDGSKILTLNTDYTVAYTNNINIGTAIVTVTGKGNYTGTVSTTFTITTAQKQIAAGWIADIPAQAYTGDSIKPAVTVTDGSKILTVNTDYTVAYTNNINIGTAIVTVTGKGNYTGSASKTFTITTTGAQKQIAAGWIMDIPAQTYTGDSIKPALMVIDGNKILTVNTDYTVTYINNVNAGTAIVIVIGIGNYSGSANLSFTINTKQIAGDCVESIPAQTYTGDSIMPAVTVRDGNNILTKGVHYSATYSNNVNAGTATVTVTGLGNYTGTASQSFAINFKQIAGEWLESIPTQTYTGDSIKPALTIRDGNNTLIAGVHYFATYSNNVNAGTATVTVTGLGSYIGTASKTFTINSKQIAGDWLENIPAQTYTGDFIKPAVTVRDGNSILTAGVHYSATHTNNLNAGAAIATVTGIGNYTGSAYTYFTINPKPVVSDWIENIPNQAYTGNYIQPALTVRDGSAVLTPGVHYSATYNNNLNVGTATVTITGIGNYTGSASKNFLIGDNTSTPVSIAAGWIDDIPAQTYTGGAIQPAITIRNGNTALTLGTDYTATYGNNTNAGTATVIVTGTGNYTGTAYKYFTISPKPVAAGWIGNIPDQTYTGASIQPAVTVVDGNKTLTQGMDYTVNYSNNVNAGTATVTIVGIGNYTGTATGTFNIVRSKIPIEASWVQVIPDQYYTGYSIRPAVTVAGLVQGVDYTVSYYNNVEAGTAIAVITGIGNYTGEVAQSFRITDTGIEEAASAVLRIVPADNGIFISGLTPGENFGIYTLQGQLVYQSKATSPEEHIYLQDKGVYILRHKDRTYKFYR